MSDINEIATIKGINKQEYSSSIMSDIHEIATIPGIKRSTAVQ